MKSGLKSSLIAFFVLSLGLLGAAEKGFQGEIHMKFDAQGNTGAIKIYVGTTGTKVDVDAKAPKSDAVVQMSMLLKDSEPGKVYQMMPAEKAYMVMDTKKMEAMVPKEILNDEKEFKSKVMGKEKVLGYNTSHVQLTREGEVHDLWIATEFDFTDLFSRLQKAVPGQSKKMPMFSALENAGVKGLPLKSISVVGDSKTTMEVTKVEKKPIAATQIAVPAGYKEMPNPMELMGAMGQGGGPTPEQMEQLKKMIEQMQKKQAQGEGQKSVPAK